VNANDEMNDTEVLGRASDSLSQLSLATPPDVTTVMSRGRSHRSRRFGAVIGLAVGAVAVMSGGALGLTSLLGFAPGHSLGTIRTEAYVLVHNADGTSTLTIDPRELFDATTLQNDLAQFGIPATVTTGSFCSSDPAPAGFSQVVSFDTGGERTVVPGDGQVPAPTVTIDPAAMPAGAELTVGVFVPAAGQQQVYLALLDTSSSSCTSTPGSPPGVTMLEWSGQSAP